MNNPQLNKHGELQHLLTTEGLPAPILRAILDKATEFLSVAEGREIKKVPLLHGKSVFNIFFENSTRTRTTFEIAAKRLSADVINLNVSASSTSKGETLLDTIRNLEAMHTDLFVVRHAESGAAHLIARHVPAHVHIINAGDGRHAHPTQGLLDLFTMAAVSAGVLFFLAGVLGLLRFPDALTRLHALTKADNVGLGLIVAGLLPQAGSVLAALKLILVWLTVLLAGATVGQLIARVARRAGPRT